MSALVTGDAVVLGLRPARLPSRLLAMAIDMAVAWGGYLLVSMGLAVSTGSLDDAAVTAVSIASFLLVLVGVPIAVETLSHGRSLGKLACGLRVVREDGGPIRFRHALVRGAMGVAEILMTFGTIACIASLVSARGRRIGDVFAGTLVVRERLPAGRGAEVPPPPAWPAGRFAELDLSAVPDQLWLSIHQCLTRMSQLDGAVGAGLAERLANDLVDRTGVPAPEGVPPAAFLAAVVHERRAREARRAFGSPGSGAGGVVTRDGGVGAGAGGGRVAAGGWVLDTGEAAVAVRGPYAPGSGESPAPAAGRGGGPWAAPGRVCAAGVETGAESGSEAAGQPEEQPEKQSEGRPGSGRATGFAPPA
ncbi:RDD family protein [Streptomyces sp. CAU 1734]|uniref:RDD family protein n=1 Tax=Streptomyces sp. CAU 1734 TaxID=3140360 RepID=UPI0032607A65